MIVLPTICSQERIEAKSIGSKCFSNRKYRIRVDLFEHQMAIAEIDYKGGLKTSGSPFIYFDECRRESVYDLSECMDYLKHDKVARRWFRHYDTRLVLQSLSRSLFHQRSGITLAGCP